MVIYKITNTINNKVYIGQTARTLKERICEHKKLNKYSNLIIHKAVRKYGWSKFAVVILDVCTTLEELNEKEIYYIHKYKSTDIILVNQTIGERND